MFNCVTKIRFLKHAAQLQRRIRIVCVSNTEVIGGSLSGFLNTFFKLYFITKLHWTTSHSRHLKEEARPQPALFYFSLLCGFKYFQCDWFLKYNLKLLLCVRNCASCFRRLPSITGQHSSLIPCALESLSPAHTGILQVPQGQGVLHRDFTCGATLKGSFNITPHLPPPC